MAVQDKQKVNAAVTNAAFVSRTVDSDTKGRVGLKNTLSESGANILNIQRAINKAFEASGITDETDTTVNTYSSTNYVSNGDSKKVAVGKLDAKTKLNSDAIATNTSGISGHETRIAAFETGNNTFAGNKTFSGNVNVNGDLHVIGTTYTQSQLEVTDTNVTVNKSGTNIGSEGAGLTVDRVGNKGSLIYKNASPTKFAAGDIGAEINLVDESTSQTLSNKKLTTALYPEGSSPATPPAGYRTMFAKPDGFYDKDSTGTEKKVGSGSGGGGDINLISNPIGELGTVGYAEGSYPPASRPTGTFTASAGAGAFAVSTTTTQPLGVGTTSLVFTKFAGASRQGRSVEVEFNLPIDYRAKLLTLDNHFIINSGAFVAGAETTDSSMIFYTSFWDGTSWTPKEPSSFKLFNSSTIISDRQVGDVQSPYNATKMKIIAYVAETTNSAWEVKCILSVGPKKSTTVALRGPVGSVCYTPSLTPPFGYLYADGSAVSRSQYSKLFAVCGTTYGAGDGSTTFNIPNLKGVFVRGAGSQTIGGITSAATLGATQGDQFQGHKHQFLTAQSGASSTIAPAIVGGFNAATYVDRVLAGDVIVTDGANGATRIGAETRPANVSMAAHICFDDGSVQIADSLYTPIVVAKYGFSSTAAGTANQPLVWNKPVYDTVGGMDTTTGNYLIKYPGYYTAKGLTQNVQGTSSVNLQLKRSGNLITDISPNGNYLGAVAQSPSLNTFGGGAYFNAGENLQIVMDGVTQQLGVNSYVIIERISTSSAVAAGFEPVSAEYYSSSGQSLAASVGSTIVWNGIVNQTHPMLNLSTGEITLPSAGKYLICVGIEFASRTWNTGNTKSIQFYKSDALVRYVFTAPAATYTGSYGLTAVYPVSGQANEKVRIYVNPNENTNSFLSTTLQGNWMSITKIANI